MVRAAVAINDACGPDIDLILAGDSDERVRALLGSRIARLLPELDCQHQDSATRHVHATLAALARDHATRVRAVIAHEVGAMPEAPRDLVLILAHDETGAVSDPVLRLSPVLTDADLLALLATPRHGRVAESVASRAGLSASVADAIAEHADAPAICALLANHSASIRETTLDALVGRASYHADWHEPLVRRPCLSAKATRALAQIVAADLLKVLRARTDLDPAVVEAVRHRVTTQALDCGKTEQRDSVLVAECERLKAMGRLAEHHLIEAAQTGDVRRAAACLAVASGVTLRVVDRMASLRSARAIVSLVARAGFSMQAGVVIQGALAQLGPDHLLRPGPGGGFPLSDEEMDWQFELHTGSVPADDAEKAWSGQDMVHAAPG